MTTLQRLPTLHDSKYFRHQLNSASHSNAVKDILKLNSHTVDLPGDFTSVLIFFIVFVAFAAGLISYFYVSKKTKTLNSKNNTEITGVVVARSDITAPIDIHIVCVTSLNVTLPSPESLFSGRYVSVSVPMPLDENADSRSVQVIWQNPLESLKTFSIAVNSGALFMVSNELNVEKWKVIRQW